MMRDKYLEIINHFGFRNQMKKLHEEVFEMLEAIDNYEDSKSFDADISSQNVLRDCMIEEIADVLTLMTQFMMYYDIEETELNEVMDYKLYRTLKRIKDGYYEDKK